MGLNAQPTPSSPYPPVTPRLCGGDNTYHTHLRNLKGGFRGFCLMRMVEILVGGICRMLANLLCHARRRSNHVFFSFFFLPPFIHAAVVTRGPRGEKYLLPGLVGGEAFIFFFPPTKS